MEDDFGAAGGTADDTQQSPEDALANMGDQLTAAQDAAARERQARIDAEFRAAEATGAARGAHSVAVASAIEAENARLERARASYRTAREAGDLDAEQKAIEESGAARARLERLNEQKTAIERAPQQQPQRQAAPEPGPAAKQWLADHPKHATDPVYRAALQVVHDAAVAGGLTVESPQYFDFAERELSTRFGPNHGKDAPVGDQGNRGNGSSTRRPAASGTAPGPSRGGSSPQRGTADVNSIAAKLGVPPDEIVAHAIATYPRLAAEKGDNEAVARYVKAQEAILSERDDSITVGNGRMYRV